MEHLLSIGVSNAVAALILALVAAAVCRVYHRPALAHALWLLVLLKLVTPPIWTVPVAWLTPAASTPVKKAIVVPESPAPVLTLSAEEVRQLQELGGLQLVEVGPTDDRPQVESGPTSPAVAPALSAPNPVPTFAYGRAALAAAWLVGTALFLTVALVRVGRFRRVLAYATRAPADVEARARRIARRLGLADSPGVWFVPGAVCPMLWAAGGPARLLVPAGLWERLSADQRDTLLAHELAHLRRRDHWVRPLELLATALYWWHPAVWWARHELREAEEQCCDAWVVWSLPGSLRHYMNALLEAVEYVSEGFDRARPGAPALASGMGQFQHLKRRLLMMKQRNVTHTRSLTWAGFAAVCGAAALLLPLAPTLAQQQSEDVKKEITQKVTEDRQGSADESADTAEKVADVAVEASPDVTTNVNVVTTNRVPVLSEIPYVGDLFQYKTSADAKGQVTVVGEDGKSEISADRLVLDHDGKTVTLDGKNGIWFKRAEDVADKDDDDGKGDGDVQKARAEVQRLSKELERAAKRLADLETKRAMSKVSAQMRANKLNFRLARPDEVNPKDAAKLRRMSEALQNGRANNFGASGGDDVEQRLNVMEKHLAQMMEEMKQLRAEGKDRQKQKDKEKKDKKDRDDDGDGHNGTSQKPL